MAVWWAENKGLSGQHNTQDVFHKMLTRLCLRQVFDFIKAPWIYFILQPSCCSKNDEALIPALSLYNTPGLQFNLTPNLYIRGITVLPTC